MQGIAAFPPGPRPPRTLESRTAPGTIESTVVAISKDRNTHRLASGNYSCDIFLVFGCGVMSSAVSPRPRWRAVGVSEAL